MSLATLSPSPADEPDGDFALWEDEVAAPAPRLSRAAERRQGRDDIDRQLGIRRHRTGEREA
ncbi:MAG TPA: hypothetical protein VI172_14870 [Candidatus Dormibacteraeota bacterium]|jgi:hypothetical protein